MPAAPVSGQEMIEGQLNAEERRILTEAIRNAPQPPRTLVEVGTWLGGGSTLHILRAMQANGVGHLWGIEAHREMYERMIANLRAAAPDALDRFTPLFGFSEKVIPRWLAELPTGTGVDFVFLDGGDNPREQLAEFQLLDPHIPVGGQLLAHDAKIRKGKWLGPFLRALDHWETTLHDVSDEGLLHAIKRAVSPSPASRAAARRIEWRMRLQPAEIAAAILPSAVCSLILRLLPNNLSRRLSDGR